MTNNYAIILAGGHGKRLTGGLPKQFLNLANRPILIWTLEKFSCVEEIYQIIIVAPEEYIIRTSDTIKQYEISKKMKIIPGGETRQASSYNAITCMNFDDDDILIFHDAARPFVNRRIILESIKMTETDGACGVYMKAIDTIAEINNEFVFSIPERDTLYYTQTPQSFKYRIISQSHEIAREKNVFNATDDIQIVLDAGFKVKAIEGDYRNIKITTPFDYELAQCTAAAK